MLQHAKRQGSPWKSPGAKPTSPRVSRLPGRESRLLEPEEQSWDASSDLRPSSSTQMTKDNSSIELQAAPKEAEQSEDVPPRADGSASGSQSARAQQTIAALRSGSKQGNLARNYTSDLDAQRGRSSKAHARSAMRGKADKVRVSAMLFAALEQCPQPYVC